MSSITEEERLNTCVIPENFVDTGRIFNGMFRTRNLIEGAIFAAPFAYVISKLGLSLDNTIVVGVIVVGGILGVFITGINGDSVTEFLIHVIKYNKHKRVAKYNPRVKTEATPGYLTKPAIELPRDKILRLIGEFNESRSSVPDDDVSRDIYDPKYQEFFEDDLGYVATPDDLKSRSELRQEAKARKRIAKAEKKAAKQKKKDAKKESKQKKKDEKKAVKQKKKENKKNRAKAKHAAKTKGGL